MQFITKLGNSALKTATLLALATLTFTTPSLAADVTLLFRSPGASKVDFNAYTKLYPEQKTFVEFLKEKGPAKVSVERLKALFIEAQKSYLQDPTHVAKAQWKKVVALMHTNDWAMPEKEIFVIALLRLAQLEAEQAPDFIRQALIFYFEYVPSNELFPPNLMQLWSDLKKTTTTLNLSLAKWRNYDLVLVDGVSHLLPLERQIRVSEGFHRFTFLSQSHLPVTILTQAKDIESYDPANDSLVFGDCKSPRLNPNAPYYKTIKKFHVVFADCISEQPSASAAADDKPLSQTTRPIGDLSKDATNAADLVAKNNFNEEKTPATPFYQKKSFWYGVAAFAAASLVVEHNNSKNDNADSRRSGW